MVWWQEFRAAAQPGAAPGSAADPWGPWADRVSRSEGGAEWTPTEPPSGGAREGDIGWDDFGRS